jgi:hypothetical protein
VCMLRNLLRNSSGKKVVLDLLILSLAIIEKLEQSSKKFV